ncbi:hypothetical protein ONZ51_g9876 [Trametes cubensis]|uniref:Uncharacterized protein n=1 Tax=Trametes cubensis TaxID=1111947 RepID=A0AAD7TKK4_9APHY|nr:hypothetical protein ONZ51_g9876 [Trametes cubensis]
MLVFATCALEADFAASSSTAYLSFKVQRVREPMDAADFVHRLCECQPASPSEPSSNAKKRQLSILLFPVEEDTPKVVQTEIEIGPDPERPSVKKHLLRFQDFLHCPKLFLAFDPNLDDDDAPQNRAIQKLLGDGPGFPLPLRGVVVGYRAREPAREFTQFLDVSLKDVSAFTSFLRKRELPESCFQWYHLGRPLGADPDVPEQMLSVLLFPAGANTPQLVQTKLQIQDDPDNPGEKKHAVDFESFLHTSTTVHIPFGPVCESTSPPSRLFLAFDSTLDDDDAPRNPVIGYRAREPVNDFTQFMDVSLADVPAIASFLRSRKLPEYRMQWRQRGKGSRADVESMAGLFAMLVVGRMLLGL